MRNTVKLLLVISLTLNTLASAQDDELAKVKGRVTTYWGKPIGGVQVSFYQLEGINGNSPTENLIRTVVADKEGNYKADKLPWGQYRESISHPNIMGIRKFGTFTCPETPTRFWMLACRWGLWIRFG